MQEVTSGTSFMSQNDLRLHFGLGTAKSADMLEVLWPSGAQENFPNVPGNQFIRIREGSGALELIEFKPRTY